MKVPQNLPAYMEAYHLYLKDHTRKSFDLAYLEQHWDAFHEHMEATAKPKRVTKPSKARAMKGLEKAMQRCDEVVNHQADPSAKKAVAAEVIATQKALNGNMSRMADPKVLGEKLLTEGVMACTRGAQIPAHALHAATEDEDDDDDNNRGGGGGDGLIDAEMAQRAAAAKHVADTIKRVLPPTVVSLLRKRSRDSDSSNSDNGDAESEMGNGGGGGGGRGGGSEDEGRARKRIRTAMEKCSRAMARADATRKTRLVATCGDEIVAAAPLEVVAYIRNKGKKPSRVVVRAMEERAEVDDEVEGDGDVVLDDDGDIVLDDDGDGDDEDVFEDDDA